MKIWRNIFVMAVAFALASCSRDPQWADEELHLKNQQLQEQFAPLVVGTWHIEVINDKQRFFERLTFLPDKTLKGMRKWQLRRLVTIGGVEQYTDWEDVTEENGSFTGRWQLSWEREYDGGPGANRLSITADFDDKQRSFVAYSLYALFHFADATTLSFSGGYYQNSNGVTNFIRGEAEPSF